jgi:glycosyltransferase involved in cell wall biosynthesis
MGKSKIALIIPMLQPYRVTLYERLIESTKDKYEWCIFNGVKDFDDARPDYKGNVNFRTKPYKATIKTIGPLSACIQKNLYRDVVDFDPDIVLVNANTGELGSRKVAKWASKNNKRLILWICSWDSGKAKGIFRWFKRKMMGTYYKKGNYFIAYSSHAFNLIKSFSISPIKIGIAYNGLDLFHLKKNEADIDFQAELLRQKITTDKKNKVFLYVGGLIPMKSPFLLIDAFLELYKSNKNIELWIIGDGPLRAKLEQSIKICGNKAIKYFGRITEGVDPYFKAADWFVLPGAGGLALNQSMFWRTPCICSVADGSEDDLVLDEITGYRFVKDDVNSLRNAMQKALSTSSEKHEKMGIFAKYLIEQRSNTDKMFDVFLQAIKD